jgi:hypothetical protein
VPVHRTVKWGRLGGVGPGRARGRRLEAGVGRRANAATTNPGGMGGEGRYAGGDLVVVSGIGGRPGLRCRVLVQSRWPVLVEHLQ